MKETPISGIEKAFVLEAISQKRRLDGRSFKHRRNLRIIFGKEWGSCYVALGETKVLAQVSCEIQQPKATRPNEGLIYINVDISPMAAVHVEPGKPSEACVEVNRILEKCIKESKCVDLESLCIIADEKVWALRVDITVLNLEGNIAECASIAALAGLAHFKRPDVTSTGEGIIIHDASEKDPIPTTLHHFPICLCYAIFNKGEYFVADPTEIEEKIAEAHLSVGMNAFGELCGLHLKGKAITNHNAVIQCVKKAAATASEIVLSIKNSLIEDEEGRAKGEELGFAASIEKGRITSLSQERMQVRIKIQDLHEAAGRMLQKLHQNKRKTWDEDGMEYDTGPADQIVVQLGENSAELVTKDNISSKSEDSIQYAGTGASSSISKANIDRSKRRKPKHRSSPEEQNHKELQNCPLGPQDNPDNLTCKDSSDTRTEKAQSATIFLSDSDEGDGNAELEVIQRVLKEEKERVADSDEEDGDELEVVREVSKEEKERMKLQMVENITLDDSEEEETTTLTHQDLENPKVKSPIGRNLENSKIKKQKKKKKKSKASTSDQPSRGWYPLKKW